MKSYLIKQKIDETLNIFRNKFGLGDEEEIISFVSKLMDDFDARSKIYSLAKTKGEIPARYRIAGEEYIWHIDILLGDIKIRNELKEKILTIHRLLREDGVAI